MPDMIHSDLARRLPSVTGSRRPLWLVRVVVMLGVCIVASILLAASLFALKQGTWTYSSQTVDPATQTRLARLHEELIAQGAPDTALRAVAAAARPGRFLGDAIEALADADKSLAQFGEDHPLAATRMSLRGIYAELYQQEYVHRNIFPTPSPVTPLLSISTN